jgi:hypothetical protein
MVNLSTGIGYLTLNECCGRRPEIEEEKNTACVFCWECGRQTNWVGYRKHWSDNIRDAVEAWNNGETFILD